MNCGRIGLAAGLLACCMTFLWQSPSADAKEAKPTETVKEKKSAWQPELRVGLLSGQSHVNLRGTAPCVLQESDTGKRIVFFSPGKSMKISVTKGKLAVDGKKVDAEKLTLRPQQKKPLTTMRVVINGEEFFGGAEILLRGGSMTVCNLVTVEDYLRSVLPEEMPSDWPEEALKAQAVAARTFALQHRKRHEDAGYDLCDTTHCQVYESTASVTGRTDRAVSATYGEVLTYREKLISAVFHTDSGGMTEKNFDVWGTEVPYLQSAKEAKLHTQPWTVTYSVPDFSAKLTSAGRGVGTVKQVKLSRLQVGKSAADRSSSGRVKTLEIKGNKETKKITGNDMRSIFGLKSTLFDISISKNQVTITGYGWGHGVGMSQWGAKAYAEKMSYDKILSHYYKNTKLKKLY